MKSEKGKEILMHAANSEYCVLEFEEMDDGSMQVRDITEHHRQLERRVLDSDPAAPIDEDAYGG